MSTEINPLLISSIRKCNEVTLHPLQPTMHGGGGFGKVISVVAAMAVPVFAPTIASSIGLSQTIGAAIGNAAAGSVIGSAITGAALGAVTAVVSGQNVGRGALMGGITSGLTGYLGAGSGGAENTITTAGGETAAGSSSLPPIPDVSGANVSPVDAVFGPSAGGTSLTPSAPLVRVPQLGDTQALTNLSERLTETLTTTGSKVLDKVTNPDALASLTVQAAGQLVAGAMMPESGMPGFSPEEQELVAARRQELEELKARDLEAYNNQIAISKQYLVQAGLVDPTYFATQAANRSLILGARQQKQRDEEQAFDPFREITPGEQSRVGLALQRDRNTAFDKGFMQGLNVQNQFTESAVSTAPKSSPTNYSDGLAGLQNTLAYGSRIGDTKRQNVANLSSTLNTTSGRSAEDQDKIDTQVGLATGSPVGIGDPNTYLDDMMDKNNENYLGNLGRS